MQRLVFELVVSAPEVDVPCIQDETSLVSPPVTTPSSMTTIAAVYADHAEKRRMVRCLLCSNCQPQIPGSPMCNGIASIQAHLLGGPC
jgi:hypothetical protein